MLTKRMMAAFALAFLLMAEDSLGKSQRAPADIPPVQAPSSQAASPSAADHRGTDQVPLTVKILPSQEAKEYAEMQERERAEKAENDKRLADQTQRLADDTGWLAIITGFLFAAALGQITLFYWQLKLIRESLIDAKKAADSAKESADTARIQADVATDTLRTMQDTAERQLRAYVFVENVKFELAPNSNRWSIFLCTKNFGQTPAYSVVITIDREIAAPKPDDATLQPSANIETLFGASIGPGANLNGKLPCDTPYCNLAPGIGAWLNAGQSGNRAYLWGRIDYVTFKKRRWTTFQMLSVFGEIHEFGFCANGNHSDEEET